MFLYCLDLLLRSVEHTNITVANTGRAVLQWAYSGKLSVKAVMNYQSYNFKKSSFCRTLLMYHVSNSLNLQVQIIHYQLQLQLMRIHAEVVETALCNSLYSLKFQVWVACQPLQLQSKIYVNSYRRSWNYIMWFVIYHYKLSILLYRSSINQPIVNSPHHETFFCVLRNASRDTLISICLLNFHNNHASFLIPLCW